MNFQLISKPSLPKYAKLFDIRDACSDKSKPFCICWKKAGKNGAPSVGQVAVIPIEYFMNCLRNEKLIVKGPIPTIKNCVVNDFDDEYALYLRTAKKNWRTEEAFSLEFDSTLSDLKRVTLSTWIEKTLNF